MNQLITFTDMFGVSDTFYPEPASKNIPQWYKDMESYMSGEKKPSGDGTTTGTIKRCMPVFDVLNSGYIIKTPADVYISQREVVNPETNEGTGNFIPVYEWSDFGLIKFHPVEQAPNHPNKNGHTVSYPKWTNPWAIKTPKGYSTLFVQPFHRESVFTILPGVVDTDKYIAPVNFPFVLNDINFEGLIPAGTPMAQVIPFKRDSWKMQIGDQEQKTETQKTHVKLRSRFFDSYKNQFRTGTTYK